MEVITDDCQLALDHLRIEFVTGDPAIADEACVVSDTFRAHAALAFRCADPRRFAGPDDAPDARDEPRVSYRSVVIELMQFRLLAGTHDKEFLAADRRLQTEFAYQQPGLLRRTTTRGQNGEWLVIDHWRTDRDADACAERWDQDPIAQSFMDLIDRSSVRVQRFWTV